MCKSDFRLRTMEISASKNKSSFPANGLFGRRAPLATVWMQPNDSVHHDTIRLVSLSLRLRNRMAAVVSTVQVSKRGNCRGACAKYLPLNFGLRHSERCYIIRDS